ncbi:hypothetical protein BCR32DRAFT_240097 [Anaeromyces robustus]|uniref:Transmembrane protein n=1 Tax=Anaeromyces robustus TaxID=1754192 RepID=A0A1Y1XQL4_9FUNG|nr:hypothetical protein BCR32DRAFT_240097 [Anaeromyces robustus]|eukprot:ORX87614.1 hypothetical protein BCR32DRAFT_240097 [Anaeromyces robustus]
MGLKLNDIILRVLYTLITVIITVHAFVFYSIYVVGGDELKQQNEVNFVLDAVNKQGGVYMFGTYLPIWEVILIECCIAFGLELTVAGPSAFKLASQALNQASTPKSIFDIFIIGYTVSIMCPSMSFLASIFFYPYNIGFNVLTLIANWFQLICYNFPFAFFMQVFLIQPFMRKLFKLLFGFTEGEEEKSKNLKDNDQTKKNMTEIKNIDKDGNLNFNMTKTLQLIDQLKKEIMECSNNTLIEDTMINEQEIVEVQIDQFDDSDIKE